MSSLGNEKENWIAASERLTREKGSLVGDIIISTGFLNYLGPFDGTYREKIV